MKFPQGLSARIAVAAAGGLLLAGGASAAIADELDTGDVDVTVDIESPDDGALTLTVGGTSTSLAEVVSGDPTIRQFDGQLPQVTVSDTRDPDSIPDGSFWSVYGQATDFVGQDGQPDIPAENLGWTPEVLGDYEYITEGDPIGTVLDDGPEANVGLVEGELLYSAFTSEDAVNEGNTSWSATAGLTLKTDADVAPGAYASVLTISLFEDIG